MPIDRSFTLASTRVSVSSLCTVFVYFVMIKPNNNPFQLCSWWRHQMEIFSPLLALCEGNSPVTGGFPLQRSLASSLIFSWLRLNKRLSKQSRHRWFEMSSCSLWRHCNDIGTAPFSYDITLACWTHFRNYILCLSCIANTMDADGLATQGARASVAILLGRISRNIPLSSPEGLNKHPQNALCT